MSIEIPLNRPYIVCHMLSSLDGRSTSGTEKWIFGDYQTLYDQLHASYNAQAWMCGRTTMEMHAESANMPLESIEKDLPEGDFIAPHSETNFSIAVDTKGALRWRSNTITLQFEKPLDHHLVVIITQNTPKEYLAFLRSKGISYIFGGPNSINFTETFSKLKELFGIERMLLEGGAVLNGSIIPTGLIDEISILLVPMVVNNSAAHALFESKEISDPIQTFKYQLVSATPIEQQCVWLKYQRETTAN